LIVVGQLRQSLEAANLVLLLLLRLLPRVGVVGHLLLQRSDLRVLVLAALRGIERFVEDLNCRGHGLDHPSAELRLHGGLLRHGR
jgi:hypothetical protein